MSTLWKIFETVALWIGWMAFLIVLMIWLRHRAQTNHQTHLEEFMEHEMDEDTGVGFAIMFALILIGIASFAVPGIATWHVWGGGDGCKAGMHNEETGQLIPIVTKNGTFFIPETVCVLDQR